MNRDFRIRFLRSCLQSAVRRGDRVMAKRLTRRVVLLIEKQTA
jgi:hypothetical protein